MNITMRYSSSSSARNVDGVGRTKALSSSPAGGALGVDMTFTRRLRQGADDRESTGKVPMMLTLLMPTAASFEPCVHRRAEISLILFCGFQ